jgi:diguanylate cyclase (GGDEF)-like protein
MDVYDLKACYLLGFHAGALSPAMKLEFGDFTSHISQTDALYAITPLKSSIKRLIKDRGGNKLNSKLDEIYSIFERLKKGQYETRSEANSLYYHLEDLCKEVEMGVSEFADGSLKNGALQTYLAGRYLASWSYRLEGPVTLNPDNETAIVSTFTAAGFEKAAALARSTNEEMKSGESIYSGKIDTIHSTIINQLNARITLHCLAGSTSINTVSGLRDFTTFEVETGLKLGPPEIPIAIAFIDIDDFKAINTEIGHDAADLVIKEIASRLEKALIGRADVYHRSGDEFLAVFLNTTSDEAAAVLKRAKGSYIEKEAINVNDRENEVTITAGIAMYPDDGLELELITGLANKAMLKGKESAGVSQIVVHRD